MLLTYCRDPPLVHVFIACPHVTVTWSPWVGGTRQYNGIVSSLVVLFFKGRTINNCGGVGQNWGKKEAAPTARGINYGRMAPYLESKWLL